VPGQLKRGTKERNSKKGEKSKGRAGQKGSPQKGQVFARLGSERGTITRNKGNLV